ncbi:MULTISPECIES: hypothetical protein [unclassified Halorhabdus]|uniref:hypothetical protein n=1 Tax=unclassified Halorhabdus TaxID=2621901 RepID=UPI0012B25A45|nr:MULTISPECIES: hypothetical protein [unclassified Halorhabdus]
MEAETARSEGDGVPPRDVIGLVLFVGLYAGHGLSLVTFETTVIGLLSVLLLYQIFS